MQLVAGPIVVRTYSTIYSFTLRSAQLQIPIFTHKFLILLWVLVGANGGHARLEAHSSLL